jgi:hypothetical protein
VPAPKTSAPLACRYMVRLWVAVPGPYVDPKSCSLPGTFTVADESRKSPGGRNPFTTSSSHS